MNTFEAIQQTVSSDIISGTTNVVLGRVTILAEYIAGILLAIAIAWNILISTFKKLQNKNHIGFIDKTELFRVIAIIIIIGIYPIISKFLVSSIDHINHYTAPKTEVSEQMRDMVENRMTEDNYLNLDAEIKSIEAFLKSGKGSGETRQLAEDVLTKLYNAKEQKTKDGVAINDDSSWKSTFMKLGNMANNPSIISTYIVGGIFRLISNLIRGLVMLFATVLFKLLIIVGPLAFAFSILPTFRDKIEQWFQTLLTVGLSFTTIHILDHLYFELMGNMWENMADVDSFDVLGKHILDFGLIISYSMVFWITSKFVGTSEAGRFISKGVGLTAMAIGGAVSMVGKVSTGGVSTGAGTVKNVISAGSKAVQNQNKE
jgi:hypothetical protein